MKATIRLIENSDEMERAHVLNLDKKPKPRWKDCDYYFDIDGLEEALRGDDNDIMCRIFGEIVKLKYEEETWKKITSYLEYK